VHEHFFKSGAPALTVIEAAEVGHKGTLIEIEPTAIIPGRGVERRMIDPDGWRAPARMSACVEAGGLAFLSAIPGTGEGAEAQASAAVSELAARLATARRQMTDVAALTVYLRDMDDFPSVERVLEQRFDSHRPALTALEVPAVSPLRGARVALTAIGWFGE
jgi:enamine deaminase RidA (YjgF/YER057c/UK114 family)